MVEEEGIKGEFVIVGFIDDLEECMRYSQKRDFESSLIDSFEAARMSFFKLDPYLKTAEHYAELREKVEDLLTKLLKGCKKGEESDVAKDCDRLQSEINSMMSD